MSNPITSNISTDLMYFGRSPYGAGDDTAMTYANFAAQFGAPYTAAALTSTSDTNVTITLGGTPATALLQAASITMGWTGTLSGARGGTGVANTGLTINLGSGSTGYVLTSDSSGNATWQAVSASGAITTIQGNSGTATPVAGTVSITGGATGLTTDGSGSTLSLTGTLVVANGGTGQSSLTTNNLLAGGTTATGALQQVASGTSGQLLQSNAGSSVPSWTTATFPSAAGAAGTILRSNGTGWVASTSTFADTYATNTILYSNGANTITGLAPVASAVLLTDASSALTWSSTMTNGQLIIGSTSGTPTAATLTAGTGITITNGAGSISIASNGADVWVDQTTSSVNMTANTGYTSDAGASLVTFTLPATAAIGDWIEINGKGAGGWTIAQASGQQINFGNVATTIGAGGSLSSSNQWDCIKLRCVTADTIFTVVSSIGNITYV